MRGWDYAKARKLDGGASFRAEGQVLKAILWDNDGVLVDTEGLYYQSNQETFAEVGHSLAPETFLRLSEAEFMQWRPPWLAARWAQAIG